MSPMNQVQYLNPEALHKNPAFTNVVVVTGPAKTVYVGGQDAVDASGNILGKGDLKAQTDQVLKNIQAALAAGGACLLAQIGLIVVGCMLVRDLFVAPS
jgi:enamine deaminase RidA (YjgF/YER057c/UK114 family)